MKRIVAFVIMLIFLFSGCSGTETLNTNTRLHSCLEVIPLETSEKSDITNSKINEVSEEISHEEKIHYLRGSIFDTNMECVLFSEIPKNETPYRKMNEKYTGLSNIFCDQSEGFDTIFENILRSANPVIVSRKAPVGQSIQLTINADISQKIYDIMRKENIVGSVAVMRSDGSIATLVSTPSYDANKLRNDPTYNDELGNTGAFINRTLHMAAPGSTFKILSEVLTDIHGIDNLTDEGRIQIQGSYLQNWDFNENYSYPFETNRLSAFLRSSNVYFAKVFGLIGKSDVISDLKKYFLFGDDVSIDCDFTLLENSLDIENEDNLYRSGFGQGNVRTTPIYLSTVAREAIYGTMVKPFVLQNIIDTKENSVISSKSSPYEEITEIPIEYRENIKECMQQAGQLLDIDIPEDYNLYTKTGTANVGNGLYLYITGGIVSKNDKTEQKIIYNSYKNFFIQGGYLVTLQVQNSEELGFEFASDIAYIYNKIIEVLIKEGE